MATPIAKLMELVQALQKDVTRLQQPGWAVWDSEPASMDSDVPAFVEEVGEVTLRRDHALIDMVHRFEGEVSQLVSVFGRVSLACVEHDGPDMSQVTVVADLEYRRAGLLRSLERLSDTDEISVLDKANGCPFQGTPIEDGIAICLRDEVGLVCLATAWLARELNSAFIVPTLASAPTSIPPSNPSQTQNGIEEMALVVPPGTVSERGLQDDDDDMVGSVSVALVLFLSRPDVLSHMQSVLVAEKLRESQRVAGFPVDLARLRPDLDHGPGMGILLRGHRGLLCFVPPADATGSDVAGSAALAAALKLCVGIAPVLFSPLCRLGQDLISAVCSGVRLPGQIRELMERGCGGTGEYAVRRSDIFNLLYGYTISHCDCFGCFGSGA